MTTDAWAWLADGGWDESLHPRGEGGKFTSGEGDGDTLVRDPGFVGAELAAIATGVTWGEVDESGWGHTALDPDEMESLRYEALHAVEVGGYDAQAVSLATQEWSWGSGVDMWRDVASGAVAADDPILSGMGKGIAEALEIARGSTIAEPLYRQMGVDVDTAAALLAGEQRLDGLGVASWSRSPEVAALFGSDAGWTEEHAVGVRMRTEGESPGLDIAPIGANGYAWQQEVIVPADAYEVVSVDGDATPGGQGLDMVVRPLVERGGAVAAVGGSAVGEALFGETFAQGAVRLGHDVPRTASWDEELHPRGEGGRFTVKDDEEEPVEKTDFSAAVSAPITAWTMSYAASLDIAIENRLSAQQEAPWRADPRVEERRGDDNSSDAKMIVAHDLGERMLASGVSREAMEKFLAIDPDHVVPKDLAMGSDGRIVTYFPPDPALMIGEPDEWPKSIGRDDPQYDQFLAEAVAGELVAVWASSSNDDDVQACAVQETAREVFGMESGVADWNNPSGLDAELEKNGEVYEAFVRSQYEATQEMLREAGVEGSISLGRGVKLDEYPASESDLAQMVRQDALDTGEMSGTMMEAADLRPLSSFSTSAGTAESFMSDNYGVFLSGDVPVERIFSTAATGNGCLNESEVVVIGGGQTEFAMEWRWEDPELQANALLEQVNLPSAIKDSGYDVTTMTDPWEGTPLLVVVDPVSGVAHEVDDPQMNESDWMTWAEEAGLDIGHGDVIEEATVGAAAAEDYLPNGWAIDLQPSDVEGEAALYVEGSMVGWQQKYEAEHVLTAGNYAEPNLLGIATIVSVQERDIAGGAAQAALREAFGDRDYNDSVRVYTGGEWASGTAGVTEQYVYQGSLVPPDALGSALDALEAHPEAILAKITASVPPGTTPGQPAMSNEFGSVRVDIYNPGQGTIGGTVEVPQADVYEEPDAFQPRIEHEVAAMVKEVLA